MTCKASLGRVMAGLVAFNLTLAGAAVAQDAENGGEEEAERKLGSIVVTAQKREQSLQSIGISIKALTAETLEKVGADSLDDIVRLVPSLSMTDISRGGNNVQIRGLGSNVGNVGTVAIYTDGVISSGRIQSSGTFAEADSALYDIERVEVLRGPQGTLYGEGSFGGVINIISKQPDSTKFSASAAGTWFSTEGGTDDNLDLSGMVNIPLIEDKLAVRLVGFSYDHGGYIDAVDISPLFIGSPAVLAAENANTEKVTGGRALIGWTPNHAFDATLILKTQKTELGISNFDSPDLIDLANQLGGTSFEPRFSQALFDSSFGASTTSDEAVLTMNFETEIGTLTSITGYGEIEQSSSGGLRANNSAFSEELRLSSDNEGALNWIVGGYYRMAESDIAIDIGTTILPFNANQNDQWALFGQMYWQMSPSVMTTVGLRYGTQNTESTDLLNGLPPVSADFDDFSPKVGLDWQVNDDVLLYGSISKGFRAGGTNTDESLGTDPSFTAGFQPDEIWNYEAGAKTTLWDGKMTINAAVFYIDWSDIQIDRAMLSLIDPSGFSFIIDNGEGAHSTGIEADVFFYPSDSWEIVLGGSLVEAEFDGGTIDSLTAGLGAPLSGERLPSSPKYLFNASAEKTFEFGNDLDGYVRADYTLRGSSFGDVPNQAPPGGSFESGELTSINLRAGIRHQNWEFQAFATNLTDEYVSSFNFSDPANFANVHVVLRPRTIGASLKMFFN